MMERDEPPMVDKFAFRHAMSRMSAAVSVVTSDGPAGLSGATVTAVSSVTDTPGTLLVCVNQASWSNRVIAANGVFCVNVLAGDGSKIADIFAGAVGIPPAERFAHVPHSVLATGAPALHGAVSSIDCELDRVIDVGTHSIFVGRVVAIADSDAEEGLVYFKRKYFSVGAQGVVSDRVTLNEGDVHDWWHGF